MCTIDAMVDTVTGPCDFGVSATPNAPRLSHVVDSGNPRHYTGPIKVKFGAPIGGLHIVGDGRGDGGLSCVRTPTRLDARNG
ncbi:MAG: hypothetical protein Q8K82_22835 [Gemmatimonadaceae bacterium]|nr:hypothetical protein [Gemmatimonadaceae bacterium]